MGETRGHHPQGVFQTCVSHSRYRGLESETRAAQHGKLLSRAIVREMVRLQLIILDVLWPSDQGAYPATATHTVLFQLGTFVACRTIFFPFCISCLLLYQLSNKRKMI